MIRRPPRSTRTDTLFPYTTLFRSNYSHLRGVYRYGPAEINNVTVFGPGSGRDGQINPFYMAPRSEEHTSELQSLMRISYAVFCLKKKKNTHTKHTTVMILETKPRITNKSTISNTTT